MIITTEGFYSFEDSGDITRLNRSKKYVPGYLEIKRIQKEAQRIGEELGRKAGLKEGEKKGRKEEKIEMAKKSLEEGLSIELIVKWTGLSKEEIERLLRKGSGAPLPGDDEKRHWNYTGRAGGASHYLSHAPGRKGRGSLFGLFLWYANLVPVENATFRHFLNPTFSPFNAPSRFF